MPSFSELIKNLYINFSLFDFWLNKDFFGIYFFTFKNEEDIGMYCLFGITVAFNFYIESPKYQIQYLSLFWLNLIS